MIVTFSGTRSGMTSQQLAAVETILADFPSRPRRIAMHGCCVGADAQFHDIARRLGWFVVGSPGKPEDHDLRALCECDELLDVSSPLTRNAWMVAQADFFIAAPSNNSNGGTWHAIEQARKRGIGRRIIYPDGRIDTERTWGQAAPQQAELELTGHITPHRHRRV